jgi:hypothetical protein
MYHFGAGRPCRPALLQLRDLRNVTGDEWLLFLLSIEPFLYQSLVDELRGTLRYSAFILSRRFK